MACAPRHHRDIFWCQMTELTLLLDQLDRAYDRRSWHGTNLRGSIRGLTADLAVWRPRPGRHNIQELVVHAAYWKYAVRRRLTGEKRGAFPLKGSNWFERTIADAGLWKADVRLLEDCHRALRNAVEGLEERVLARTTSGSPFDNRALVAGIIAHDLYHAGQIQLLKRLRGR
jgi:uncharacterized damage-inducible protein DinB